MTPVALAPRCILVRATITRKPLRTSVNCHNSRHVCRSGKTRVQVVETSLGLGLDSKLLRHLALRFGSDSTELKVEDASFKEAHFGPGSGAFQEGFLNTGSGMVASSDYLEISEAGFTNKTVDECIEWCKEWADGRLYVTVGQNCWSMVGQFLEEDPDLFVPESVKFKEKQVNGWTELFVNAAQEKADKDGVEIGEVWERVMKDPSTLIPELYSNILPESIKDLIPENVEQVAENATQAKDAIVATVTSKDGEGFEHKVRDQVQDKMQAVTKHLPEPVANALQGR